MTPELREAAPADRSSSVPEGKSAVYFLVGTASGEATGLMPRRQSCGIAPCKREDSEKNQRKTFHKISAPAVQLEYIGHHLTSDLVILIGHASDDR